MKTASGSTFIDGMLRSLRERARGAAFDISELRLERRRLTADDRRRLLETRDALHDAVENLDGLIADAIKHGAR